MGGQVRKKIGYPGKAGKGERAEERGKKKRQRERRWSGVRSRAICRKKPVSSIPEDAETCLQRKDRSGKERLAKEEEKKGSLTKDTSKKKPHAPRDSE